MTAQETKHSLLKLVLFLNGAVVMCIEVVGSRTLTPYFGASVYVWTAIIGTIMAALAAGYWYGGKLADGEDKRITPARILIVAAAVLAVTIVFQNSALQYLSDKLPDLRLQATLSSVLLFGIPTFLLGMIPPYIAKTVVKDLNRSGSEIGSLYAFGTLGSIFGTFLSGYWLLDSFATRTIYWICAVTILGLSVLVSRNFSRYTLLGSVIVLGTLFLRPTEDPGVVATIDTAYGSYRVTDQRWNGKMARLLTTEERSILSAKYQGGGNALEYVEVIINLISQLEERPKSVLVIGGGAYILPSNLQSTYPGLELDVVEIDPQLEGVAKKYFGYVPEPGTHSYAMDGRVFLNTTEKEYDVVIVDAYTSLRPPFQLLTTEAFDLMNRRLKPNGTLMANVIGGRDKGKQTFFASMHQTIRTAFQSVDAYLPEHMSQVQQEKQNIIIVAGINETPFKNIAKTEPVAENSVVFRDGYAPSEKLLGQF